MTFPDVLRGCSLMLPFGVGIGIAVAVGCDIDSDCDSDPDSDPELSLVEGGAALVPMLLTLGCDQPPLREPRPVRPPALPEDTHFSDGLLD